VTEYSEKKTQQKWGEKNYAQKFGGKISWAEKFPSWFICFLVILIFFLLGVLEYKPQNYSAHLKTVKEKKFQNARRQSNKGVTL
jgi:hypothetical protein